MFQTELSDPSSSPEDQRSPDGAEEPFERCPLLSVHPQTFHLLRFPLKHPTVIAIPS